MKRLLLIIILFLGLYYVATGLWIPLKARVAQYLLEEAWSQSIVSGDLVKPWPWADSWPVGRLQQQRLGVDLIVLEGQSGAVLAFGPGHLSSSALPGSWMHCILAGHRDTSFAFLRDLVIGDTVLLEGAKRTRTYKVVAMEVLDAENLYFDGDVVGLLTLITCFPFEQLIPGGGLRYVVTATLEEGTGTG